MKRREFLKLSGCFVAVASTTNLLSSCEDSSNSIGDYTFAEGVASGDPRSTSVMLWTRVQDASGYFGAIAVVAQVSKTEDFQNIIVEKEMIATAASDHCLRLLITGLESSTIYYYRFVAGLDAVTGRTMTAPKIDDDRPVNLAWVSCQDYSAGTFGAYRQMIEDDIAAPDEEQIQVVIHLGDFIYETIGGQFQVALGDDMQPVELKNEDGTPRSIEPFPSGGGGSEEDGRYAQTLEDYRHLYKQYLRDPDLRAARARWPFIQTWDDHEFSNDCWQSQSNYDSSAGNIEPNQKRKVAANQAWFEYIPANLSDAEGVPGVENKAADFVKTSVEDVEFTDISETNNAAALASLTIYRSIRYGKNIDFVVTDLRSYRSDHSLPEELSYQKALIFHPRTALPSEVVLAFDQGMTANNGEPVDNVLGFPNVRKNSPVGTMLGEEQKAWWKETMEKTDATWKIWCNEMPMMRFSIPDDDTSVLKVDRVAFCDAWDDKPTERDELMGFLKSQSIDNVVVITGDMHAHFAGTLMDSYDTETPTAVATEFVAGGISSNSVFSFFEYAVRERTDQLKPIIVYDGTEFGGAPLERNLNVLLRYGVKSALAASETGDLTAIEEAKVDINPHLAFADSDAQGYGLMTVTSAGVETTLVTINRPIVALGQTGPGVKGTAKFSLPVNSVGELSEPVLTGIKPFPLK